MNNSEKSPSKLEGEIHRNLMTLVEQYQKQEEQLRELKSEIIERFDQLDNRATGMHHSLTKLGLAAKDANQKLDQIIALLNRRLQ